MLFRFFAVHTVTGLSDTWSLGIRQLTTNDEGKYECQAGTRGLSCIGLPHTRAYRPAIHIVP